jgi:hypothetical protein
VKARTAPTFIKILDNLITYFPVLVPELPHDTKHQLTPLALLA